MKRSGVPSWGAEPVARAELSIWTKKKAAALSLGLMLWAGAGWATDLLCVAETQCRGDAEAMCAPSTLPILLKPYQGRVHLWIDHQGPYAADRAAGDGQRWVLEAFVGHELNIAPDGAFLYRGNRGKRFLGQCETQG